MIDVGQEVGRWHVIEPLGGGGQGKTFLVEDPGGQRACMKVLVDGNNTERRARFIREAACYRSLSLEGVPGLVETNALGVSWNRVDPPYICTDLIVGISSDRLRTSALSLGEIVAGVLRLIGICEGLHRVGIVHRDIKPENTIAKGGDVSDLFLVDFGIAYDNDAEDGHDTELGQELGNRFLRLPELQSGSRAKQDPVSDLTFCVGFLFYLVVGRAPRALIDSEGKMPHQRADALVSRLRTEDEFKRLLPIFDRGFRPRTSDRFETAGELRDALESRSRPGSSSVKTLEQLIAELEETGQRSAMARNQHRDRLISIVHDIGTSMAKETRGFFVRTQGGHNIGPEATSTQVGFARADDYSDSESTRFEARVGGSEIVLTASGEEIYRTPADVPDFGEPLRLAVESALLAPLSVLIARREIKHN